VDLSSLRDWLISPDAARPIAGLFEQLIDRLVGAGFPVWRGATSMMTLHPELFARQLVWKRGTGVEITERPHELQESAGYGNSPIRSVREGAGTLRRKLTDPAQLDYPQLVELARAGATEYVIFPVVFSNGLRTYLSLATDSPEGFGDAQLAALEAVLPAIQLRFEVDAAHHATRSLLSVYLGKSAAERVLAGVIRRGQGQAIRCAVWFCDLRGFTSWVDSTPVREVLTVLDRYFDATAGAVIASGGEVLKFIGDAVLAIFPIDDDPSEPCRRALSAAQKALENVAALASAQPHPIAAGVALHQGEVMFGNIGAATRLDFTVIGAAVNEVTRIESLCKPLHTPLLLSARFAQAAGVETVDLGAHALKGVATPLQVATLPRYAPR
jgi:adenylate cyclase